MKIAFIYPAKRIDITTSADFLPMGLLYLTSVVEKEYGGTVDIFDGRQGNQYPDFNKINDYDLIGFTSMTMQITKAIQMVEKIRQNGYKGAIVFGGPHASVVPSHLQQQKLIDAFFIGESEKSFPEYLKMLEGKPHKLERVWVYDKKEWKYHEGTSYIENLDLLPFPAREKYGDLTAKQKSINMTTARGCPFQCNYCQPTKEILFGKKVRRRSTGNIIEELQDSIKHYGITNFFIDDDTFTFSRSAVLEFCEAVKPLKLLWGCQSRTDVDRETLIRMKDSGCTVMIIGAESGSQRMLDIMNKKNTVEKNRSFILTCNEIGIATGCNMMVGYPGETEEDLKMSLDFLRSTRPTFTNVSQVTPFPGTKLWDTNKDDIISIGWDDIARHVHKPKFKSLVSKQKLLKNYITLMNKRENHPISADLIDITKFPINLAWHIPYLLRLIIHKEHWVRKKFGDALENARKGDIDKAVSKMKYLKHLAFRVTRADIIGNIAWLYFSAKKYKEAAAYYRKYLKIYPENKEVRSKLADIKKIAETDH